MLHNKQKTMYSCKHCGYTTDSKEPDCPRCHQAYPFVKVIVPMVVIK